MIDCSAVRRVGCKEGANDVGDARWDLFWNIESGSPDLRIESVKIIVVKRQSACSDSE